MYSQEGQTIAAIATAQGLGGIGVIRVSGEKAISICDGIFESITKKKHKILNSNGYRAHYGHIVDDGQIIDEAILTVFRSPQSYTGENVVEVSCHGGLFLTKKVLNIIIQNGAKLAQAGEFTKRAFLNGKIGLTQAESVMDIICANGENSEKMAQSARAGAIQKKVEIVKDKLIDLVAQLLVWADYPDDDVLEIDQDAIIGKLITCKDEMVRLVKTYDAGRILKNGVSAAIVGRPNVGKSTLMNWLSGHERSIVTEIAGTTRDIVEESILLGDVFIRLLDTAGIRQTNDQVEKIGVSLAKKQIQTADLIIAMFDASQPLDTEDFQLIELFKDVKVITVVNKMDVERKIDINLLKDKMGEVIELSAYEQEGLGDLENAVKNLIGYSKIDPSEAILANERQKNSSVNSINLLTEAIDSLKSGITLDAVTVLIESAIEELLSLTGERVSPKIVDKIFEKFCVGK